MKRVLFKAILLVLISHAASAESVNYYLKRVAIHARLLESAVAETPSAEGGGVVLAAVVKNLLEDLDGWSSDLAPRGGREEVRSGLAAYRDSLLMSSRAAQLTTNQKASLSLLIAELEQAVASIQNDSPRETLGIDPELGAVRGSSWNRWGGFAGPWGPGCDPWGPYFGRPLNPGACPWW